MNMHDSAFSPIGSNACCCWQSNMYGADKPLLDVRTALVEDLLKLTELLERPGPLLSVQCLPSADWDEFLDALRTTGTSLTRYGASIWLYLTLLLRVEVETRIRKKLATAVCVAARSVSSVAEESHVAAICSMLTVVGDGLRGADCHDDDYVATRVNGCIAYLRLLGRSPAAYTPSSANALQEWFAAAQPHATDELGDACLELATVAQAASASGILNTAWRLLKALCLDTRTDRAFTAHVLAHAAAGCAQAAGRDSEEALLAARFHCSNFMRLAKEAPSLQVHEGKGNLQAFPLEVVLCAVRSELGAFSTSMPNPLLEKVVAISLEKWTAGSSLQQFQEVKWPETGQCHAYDRLFAKVALPLLASKKISDHGVRGQGRLLPAVLDAAQASEAKESSNEGADALAVLCAHGAPGARRRLLAWTLSESVSLYSLALRVHLFLTTRLGAARALAWAQFLMRGSDLVGGSRKCALRAQSQVCSCIAVMSTSCHPNLLSPWVQNLFFSELCRADELLLVRRIVASHPSVADELAEKLTTDVQAAPSPAKLRCLCSIVRLMPKEKLKVMCEMLRSILRSDSFDAATRAEAWAAHARCCERLGDVSNFRVGMRYAIKHFDKSDVTGTRVALVLSRVGGALFEGSAGAIEGLCCATWPLRAAGLAAAASAMTQDAPAAVRQVSRTAVSAFDEDFIAQSDRLELPSKRRRLLQCLVNLPDKFVKAEGEEDISDLCELSVSKIKSWLGDSRS
ncbi:unnamed protein product [Symbiodinium sp. CCMP2592]|nr:unnamed protein product [Symbiodinium sp. CCMP2592]